MSSFSLDVSTDYIYEEDILEFQMKLQEMVNYADSPNVIIFNLAYLILLFFLKNHKTQKDIKL